MKDTGTADGNGVSLFGGLLRRLNSLRTLHGLQILSDSSLRQVQAALRASTDALRAVTWRLAEPFARPLTSSQV